MKSMKKVASIICIALLFTLLLSGCSNVISLEEGTYRAENFAIDGKKVNLLEIKVLKGKGPYYESNHFYIDGEEHSLDILLIIDGKEENIGLITGHYYGKKIYYVFRISDEFLKITGVVRKDKSGKYIDAELKIGMYNPMYENVKLYFAS